MSDDRIASTVEALRRAFDSSFAEPPPETAPDEVALLAIRVGDDPVALRVHEALALVRIGRIVAVPSRRAELLGLVGVRGAVVPVYSLARLIGRTDPEPPRWAVLAGDPDRIALAFTRFERHLRAPAGDVHAATAERASHVAGAVDVDGVTRPILDLSSMVRAITATATARGGTST